MKLKILDVSGKEKGTTETPKYFTEPVRTDIIKRAVLALQAARRQPYGANPRAGLEASAYLSKRRRKYRGTYGIGQSRTPRKVMSRSGTRFNYTGAVVPQTVGGRRAHPPKAEKIWEQKINKKENRKAIKSALAATLNKEIVTARGHKTPEQYPFIISDDYQKITKTKDLMKSLEALGLKEELQRTKISRIRAGLGKLRGRKHKTGKGILFVTTEPSLMKAATNIPGTDVTTPEALNAELLAPGTVPGRLTLYTESAMKEMQELFTKKQTQTKTKKKQTKKKSQKKKTVKKKTE